MDNVLVDFVSGINQLSPELQNHSLNLIPEFKTLIKNMTIDAVCTKRSDLWKI